MTARTWRLRPAASGDLAPIMALETAIFVPDAWSTGAMRRELEADHTYYLVATPDGAPGTIDGYAGLRAPAGGQGDVQTLAVAPRARGHGLGRALMDALIREARTRGIRELFLDVRRDNDTARALYRSLGFVEIGVRPGYYQPDDVDAIVMSLALAEANPVGAETIPPGKDDR